MMTRYMFMVIASLLASVLAAAAEPEFKVYQVARAKEGPKIDGILEDPCWNNIARISGFTQVITGSGPAKEQTSVAMVSDDKALYMRIECADADVAAKVKEHDGAVYTDDCIEIFIEPKNIHKSAHHFVVNALSVQYEEDPEQGKDWNGLWETSAKKGENGWSAEVMIPFASLGTAAKEGDIWGFNVCRENYVSGNERYTELSCWSDTGGGFNAPERFGHIVFGSYLACLKDNLLPEMAKRRQDIESFMKEHPKAAADCKPRYEQVVKSIQEISDAVKAKDIITEKEFSELYPKSEATLRTLDGLIYELRLAALLLE